MAYSKVAQCGSDPGIGLGSGWTFEAATDPSGNAVFDVAQPPPGNCLYVGCTSIIGGAGGPSVKAGATTGFRVLLETVCSDTDGDQFTDRDNDCDDTDAAINPGAVEICNAVDDNCDGNVDEGLGQTTCGVLAGQVVVDNCAGGVTQVCQPGSPARELRWIRQ